MTNRIQTVFGTQGVLRSLMHNDQQFLLEPSNHGADYALLDLSGEGRYTMPVTYRPVISTGHVALNEYIHFMHFGLTSDDVSVFEANMAKLIDQREQYPGVGMMCLMREKSPEVNYMLMTSWLRGSNYFALKTTPAFKPLQAFTNRAASANGYFETGYKVLDPATFQ